MFPSCELSPPFIDRFQGGAAINDVLERGPAVWTAQDSSSIKLLDPWILAPWLSQGSLSTPLLELLAMWSRTFSGARFQGIFSSSRGSIFAVARRTSGLAVSPELCRMLCVIKSERHEQLRDWTERKEGKEN